MICPPLSNPSLLYLLMTQNAFKKLISSSSKLILIHYLTSLIKTMHLSFSVSKFVFMIFHCKFNPEYDNNGHSLSQSISYKGLPAHARYHGDNIIKAYKSLGFLHRVFKNSHCTQARKSFYTSIIRANLLHCSPLWRPCLLKDRDEPILLFFSPIYSSWQFFYFQPIFLNILLEIYMFCSMVTNMFVATCS